MTSAWKLGTGQTWREERAEIERAKIEGRADEYIAAQTTRDTADDPPDRQEARVRRRSDPVPVPVVIGAPDSEGNALLADHAAGVIEPIPVAIPAGLAPAVERVARFVALFVGCRLSCGDERPVPLGQAWVAARTGLSPATVRRCLDALVKAGFLARAGSMPARGKPDGTNLFAVVGFTQSPEDSTASSEASPTTTLLLGMALARPEPERDAALWLAAQLRDNRHDEHTAAYDAMCEYAAASGLTLGDALRVLRHAYGRDPREPWGPPRSDGPPEASIEPSAVPVETGRVYAPGGRIEPHAEPPQEPGVIHADVGGHRLPRAIAPGNAARRGTAHTPGGYAAQRTGADR